MNVIACVSSCAVDVTVYHDGYHGDLNETVFVGKVDEAGRNLVQVAYECLMKGINIGRLCGVGVSGGVEMVSGLSVNVCECSAVGAWASGSFQVENKTL